LPQDAAPRDYFQALVAGAEGWFKKRPGDPAALAQRLTEFRAGCSTIILSDHRPLSPEDHQWLVERCRKWARRIDNQLAALETTKDVDQARKEVDMLVEEMIEEIREQAGKV
jgi:hypothetical protein